jgi:hypothetical protein
MNLQTTVTFADKYTFADFQAIKYNLDSMLVRQCVAIDPITNIVEVSVFTDDGHGNGNLLYKFQLA